MSVPSESHRDSTMIVVETLTSFYYGFLDRSSEILYDSASFFFFWSFYLTAYDLTDFCICHAEQHYTVTRFYRIRLNKAIKL